MLKTYIDGALLNDFFASKPEEIPFGDAEKLGEWLSFLFFLKSNTNLLLYNSEILDSLNEIFLTQLTTGRGESSIIIDDEFDCDSYITRHSQDLKFDLFFSADIEESTSICIDQNNIFYANLDDYWEKWNRLSFQKMPKSLDVRASAEKLVFDSWLLLSKYLQKSNSVVLFDRYVLSDNSLIQSNIFKIIEEFEKINTNSYSFVIVTQGDQRNILNNKRVYEEVRNYIDGKNCKCRFGCVFITRPSEHDRTIITNYFRIGSGDSFNYFKSNGDIITKTSISFDTHADYSSFQNSDNILKDLKALIKETKESFPRNIFGDIENRILD
jgi:hypothetical protein